MVDTSPRVSVYNSPNDDESLATFHPPVSMDGAFVCMILDCSGSMSTSYSMMRTWVHKFAFYCKSNRRLVTDRDWRLLCRRLADQLIMQDAADDCIEGLKCAERALYHGEQPLPVAIKEALGFARVKLRWQLREVAIVVVE